MMTRARLTALPKGTKPGLPPASARIMRNSHSSGSRIVGVPVKGLVSTPLASDRVKVGGVAPSDATVSPSTNVLGHRRFGGQEVVWGGSMGSVGYWVQLLAAGVPICHSSRG